MATDFSEFGTASDGWCQIAGDNDYVSNYECPRWVAPIQMCFDTIEAVRAAGASRGVVGFGVVGGDHLWVGPSA